MVDVPSGPGRSRDWYIPPPQPEPVYVHEYLVRETFYPMPDREWFEPESDPIGRFDDTRGTDGDVEEVTVPDGPEESDQPDQPDLPDEAPGPPDNSEQPDEPSQADKARLGEVEVPPGKPVTAGTVMDRPDERLEQVDIPKPPDTPDQPETPDRPKSPLEQVVDRLVVDVITATAWASAAAVADVLLPGSGTLVRCAHLTAQLVCGAVTFLRGDGVALQIPALTDGPFALGVSFTMFEAEPRNLPDFRPFVDLDDGIFPPRAPNVDRAEHRRQEDTQVDPDRIDAERINIITTMLLSRLDPAGARLPPTIPDIAITWSANTTRRQAMCDNAVLGRIEVSAYDGRSRKSLYFRIRCVCAECGQVATRLADGELWCTACGYRPAG